MPDQGVTAQGTPVQGSLAPAPAEAEEIEVVACEVLDDKQDEGAPRYNLRRQPPPTFELYANPNGIEDVDLESSSFALSISITDDATVDIDDSFDINLTQIPVAERPRERTFEKGEKPRDMDEVKNMSYKFMVTQMMELKVIAKHGEKAVEALMKEYAQLDEFKVFEPLDSVSLSTKKKDRALQVIHLLKEKRDGSLKG